MTRNDAPDWVTDDPTLLARLRRMWLRRDAAPDGLAGAVLERIAAEALNDEYELLTLVGSTARLAGVRGTSDDRTLTFASEAVTIALRVSALANGRCRVDGWLSPPAAREVRLASSHGELSTTSTAGGRFEFGDVPRGTATCWVDPPAVEAGTRPVEHDALTPLRLVTAPFTL
jgi:hypothetical protein